MTPERWQQIKEVFQAALEHMPVARLSYLHAACAEDSALRAEVESLLASYEQAPSFLERPAGALLSPLLAEEAAESLQGSGIGPYRLQQELGRGGMGRVYLARRDDGQYQKQVAIKLIKHGMDTDGVMRRFRHERQTLATLDHANIARFLDGGVTEQGLPYFVMEHIEGLPIDLYCDTHKLDTIARLRLFRSVCAAVHYAHQNLIVHRDLKPGNILVTAAGVPKLLDFGLAKFLQPDQSPQALAMTMTGVRLMTPEYASPEQVRGAPITTASDVYSLGVLLYKLLTGHRPYRLARFSAQEMNEIICEQQPEKPSTAISRVEIVGGKNGTAPSTITPETVSSTRDGSPEKLRRRLLGDLDNIVLMALRKEPQRRYASVEQLADDIRRYLEGLPIRAHKDTLGYRSVKFTKRHKAGVAATVLVLLMLFAGVAGVGWQARIATEESLKAKLEAAKAQQIKRFLQEMLSAVDPIKSGKEAKNITVAEVLAEAAKRVDQELAEQPEIAAEVRTTIGITYQNLGDYDKAEPMLQRALEMRQSLYGKEHQEVAASIKNLGLLRHYQGDLKTSEPLYQQAISMYRTHGGQATRGFAEALNDYGTLLNDQGQYEQAEATLREALGLYIRLLGSVHPEVASATNNLAYALHGKGQLDSAEVLYRNALTIFEKTYGHEHPDVAHALNNLAFVLHEKGELDAATDLFQESLTIRRQLLGNDHPEVAMAVHNLAGILYHQKKFLQAERMIREAIASWERAVPENHPHLANSLFWQGRILMALGESKKAEAPLRKSLQIRQAVYSKDHFLIAKAQIELGANLLRQRRYDEAEALLQQGCTTLKATTGNQPQDERECLQLLDDLYHARGKPGATTAAVDSLLRKP